MGKYRTTQLLSAKDVGAAATEVIDINVRDVISRINIYWQTKIVTVSVELKPLTECIKRVELVDGSDVLMSLTGEQIFALNYYDAGVISDYEASLTVAEFTKLGLHLDFGRWLWDTKYALDPKKYSNLQLKIEHSEALANTSVVINELIVEADVFDEKQVSPSGFLMAKEIVTYTPASSTSNFLDLPTDWPIRKMIIQNETTDKNPFEQLDNIKLSEDNDKKVVIDMDGEEFFRTWRHKWPRQAYKMILDAVVTAKTVYNAFTYDVDIAINYDGTAFVTGQSKFAVATVTNAKIALTASVDIAAKTARITGLLPLSCMCWPFGDQDDDADWYDVTRIGSLQLIHKSGSSVGTTPEGKIVLQQARLYR